MESYLMITQINDFIFCPRSIYYSGIYRNTADTSMYHQAPQRLGTAAHEAVDSGIYSSRKNIITGMTVYSEQYHLLGRIDILDTSAHLLTERKYSVTAVYDGFRYQLFAQYFALCEMGYEVECMRLHSIRDNRNYEMPLPDAMATAAFEQTLSDIRSFSILDAFSQNRNKCVHCIYSPLCDFFDAPEEKT